MEDARAGYMWAKVAEHLYEATINDQEASEGAVKQSI